MTTIQTRSKMNVLDTSKAQQGEVWKETRNHRYVIRISPLSDSYQPQSKENKVEFNFDESSRAWRANKRATGNGCYSYLERGRSRLLDEPIYERRERPQRACRTPCRFKF